MVTELIKKVWRNRRVFHRKIWMKVVSPRKLRSRSKLYVQACQKRIGLEVGGPSSIFGDNGLLPLYKVVDRLDACNFSNTTVWEGNITQGEPFCYHPLKRPGHRYIAEATDLSMISSGKYDFLLASHVLEHVANPLRALGEWLRVTKPEGYLIVILPYKQTTFDWKRPVTKLEHLIEDFTRGVGEDDLTHLDEILVMHDLEIDPGVEGYEAFKQRALNNIHNRCLHHHVFDTHLAIQMLNYAGLQILTVEPIFPHHIMTLSRKVNRGAALDNQIFLKTDATFRTQSQFFGDRLSISQTDSELFVQCVVQTRTKS